MQECAFLAHDGRRHIGVKFSSKTPKRGRGWTIPSDFEKKIKMLVSSQLNNIFENNFHTRMALQNIQRGWS